MYLYTIGFTQKSAKQFFEPIKHKMIQLLVDVRLNNTSQMCGFTMKRDLPYLLGLHDCKYEHCANYAPTKELLTSWHNKLITWEEYKEQYSTLMLARNSVKDFITCYDFYDAVCLLCSEPTPKHCHRRLFAEMIAEALHGTEIIHL